MGQGWSWYGSSTISSTPTAAGRRSPVADAGSLSRAASSGIALALPGCPASLAAAASPSSILDLPRHAAAGAADRDLYRPAALRHPLLGLEAALIGISLNEAAYLSEILRAGIQSVPKGQREAALALGLHRGQVFRLVTWPQALRVVIPPLGNSVNGLLKTTSVASVISVDELLRRTQVLIQERFMVLELFLVAALYYLVLTTLWDLVQRRLERRFGRGYANEAADRR